MVSGDAQTDAPSREPKDNFTPVDPDAVLEKVAGLPDTRWNYEVEGPDVEHLDPTAEAFHAAFGPGIDDEHIAPLDVGGVSLVAIQALEKRTRGIEETNETLRAENAALRATVAGQRREIEQLRQENEALRERVRRLEAIVERLHK